MMSLPFIKVTAKAFKRSLSDDDSDSSSSTSTSSTSGSSTTDSSGSNTSRKEDMSASSAAIQDLRHLEYTAAFTDDANKNAEKLQRTSSLKTSVSGTTSGSTTSDTSTSRSTTSSSTSSGSESSTGGGGSGTSSSSGFSLGRDLDPDDVIDPRTKKHIFERIDRKLKTTVISRTAPAPILAPVRGRPSKQQHVTTAKNASLFSARSSMRSSRTMLSKARGLKKAKRTALLTLKIGEVIVTKGMIAPIVRKATSECNSFRAFRGRHKAERRSKTLDWFENRTQTFRREEEMERERQQTKRRNFWRTHLKEERASIQLRDFLAERRAGFKADADLRLTQSLDKEKVRDFFLGNNDRWQMQSLTRQAEEADERKRQGKVDEEADRVRDGDGHRQAAAAEYLAEYDRGEVVTQAARRMMRQSGVIAGVNAPLAAVKETPLETDSYLILRLKAASKHIEVSGNTTTGMSVPSVTAMSDSKGNSSASISKPASAGKGHRAEAERPTKSCPPPPAQESPNEAKRPFSARAIETTIAVGNKPVPPVTPTKGSVNNNRRTGGQNRGKKRSSGAFEVDLLRFRGVEEMGGWKLGAPGGESLAADFSNGACPRLIVLRLGWCSLGDRGTRTIVRALSGGGGASGAGRTLQQLDLRGNAITAGAWAMIGDALAADGFPALKDLDVRANVLRDNGGKAVARHLLAGVGTWPQIARLDLSANGMGDAGVEAVFKAVTAPGASIAPDVERFSLRDNYLSRAARRRISLSPPFLII